MSRVLVNHLRVRAGPSTNTEEVDYYDAGQVIYSCDGLIINEGRFWLRYTGNSGNKRYICAINDDGSKYVDYPENLPIILNLGVPSQNSAPLPVPGSITGLPGIPKQSDFSDNRIKQWGCCFL